MHQTRFMTALSIVFAVLLLTGAVATPAVADTDDDSNPLAEFTVSDDADKTGLLAGILKGLGSRTFGGVGNFVTDLLNNEPEPSAEADEMQSFVNDHNASFVNHTNTVLDEYNASVRNATYVLELTVYNTEGTENHTATKYFVVSADGTNLTSGRIVDNTTKPVNASKALTVFQMQSLNGDIREYHDRFVETGEIPKQGYYVGLAAQYASVSEIRVNTSEDDS